MTSARQAVMPESRVEDRLKELPTEVLLAREHGTESSRANDALLEHAAELEQVNRDLLLRSRLLVTVAEVSNFLARASDLDEALCTVLRQLGESGGLSRVLLLLEEPQATPDTLEHRVVAEWCAPGIRTHAECGVPSIASSDAASILPMLRRGEAFWLCIDQIESPLRSHFERLGIVQTGCVPIFLDEAYAGVVAFDSCDGGRLWNDVHLDALTAAANAIAASLQSQRHTLRQLEEREAAAQERAAELSKANAALRRGASRLADAGDIDSLLHAFLTEVVRASNANAGAAFLLTGRNATELDCKALISNDGTRLPVGWRQEALQSSANDVTGTFSEILNGPVTAVPTDAAFMFEHLPQLAAWHAEHGNRIAWNIPLRIGSRAIGFLGLAFLHNEEPAANLRETLEALAQQVALAVEITSLADRAREAAVAREREAAAQERAAELAKANEALRRGVEQISADRSILSILNSFLCEAVRATGGDGGAVMLRVSNEDFAFRTESVFDGELLTPEQIREHPYLGRFVEFSSNDPGGFYSRLARGESVTISVASLAESFPEAYGYHRARGDQSIWMAPLSLRNHVLGFFGIALRDGGEPTQSQRETITALAQQLVLAVQITRLAEESRASAVLREREIAAQQRAEELDRANQALRNGIAGLGKLDDLSLFLSEMLRAAVATAGAQSGGVVLLADEAQTYRVYPLLRAHGGLEPPDSKLTASFPVIPGLKAIFQDVNASSTAWMTVGDDPRMDPEFIQFHLAEGNQSIAHIPMRAGDRFLGMLGLGFSTPDPAFQKEFPLLRSLADQMTMAVEMVRISEEAKLAAIARERELAARERAAELELANEALRKGVAGLGKLDDLSLFLGEMLKAAIATAGAQGGGVNLIDEQTQTFRVHPLMRNNGKMEPSGSALMDPLPLTPGIRAIFHEIDTAKNSWIIVPDDPRMGQTYLDFHRAEGNKWIAHIPLRAGDRLLGLLGLGFATCKPKFDKELSLLRSLADQMAMAVELVRLSAEAESAAVAREQQKSADARAEELEKANAALQETTDALARANGMDVIVPTVMNIVSRASGAKTCGYFEYSADGLIRLKYWQMDGVVTNPQQTRERFGADPVMRILLEGFNIPEGYTRAPLGLRTTPDVIDHRTGTNRPDFDEWAVKHGWAMELNVPLVVDGRSIGAMTMLRERNRFTPQEIDLAVALVRQLTLAVQATRLAEESRTLAVENAVSREREIAAQERAAELARANEQLALRDRLLTASAKALEHLMSADSFASGVNEALRRIGEAAQLSRVKVLLQVQDGDMEPEHRLAYEWWMDGLTSQASLGYQVFPDTSFQEVLDHLHHENRWWGKVQDWPAAIQPIFREIGVASVGIVPIYIHQQYAGLVALDHCDPDRDWSEAEIDALTIAARGIGAALAQERMAAQLVREREQAAQQMAAELVKANHALRSSVDDLVTQTTATGILTSLLKQAVNISGARSGAILRWVASSEFEYVTIYADGSLRSSQEILAAGTNMEMRMASRVDPTGHFAALARGEARWREVEDEVLASHLPRSTCFHKSTGNRRIYDFPFQVAGQIFGYLGLAFAEPHPPSETVQETIKALATQVGLALEFRRISEQVERAAIVEERSRFARELHDSLAQGYAAILMQLGAADQAGPLPEQMSPYLDRIEKLARTNLLEARRTVSELRTSERVCELLPVRLVELARRLELAYGGTIDVLVSGLRRVSPPLVEDEFFRIAQESLTNAMKHAEASEIRMELEFLEDGLRLKVRDNGKGFSAGDRGKPDHFGLQTMQERSQRIKARLTIISEPGFGTEILTLWKSSSREQR